MASVLAELKKHGHYSTQSAEENQEALDLQEAGMVEISNGGSIKIDEESIAILNCVATAKLKKLAKDKKI